MTTLIMRNHRGDSVEIESISVTEAKNSFGQLLDQAIANGMVAITRRREPHAVLLAINEYEALMARVEDPLDRLRDESDALVARMQTPEARAAGEALFAVSEHEPEATVRNANRWRR